MAVAGPGVVAELTERFGAEAVAPQATRDEVPTAWIPRERIVEVLR